MKSTIKVGSDGIFTKLVDSDDTKEVKEWAESLSDAIKQSCQRTGKKVIILTDLTECGISTNVGVKLIIADMEEKNAPYIEKSAAYTPNFALRTIVSLLGKISKDASEETGIPQGLPLIAGASDKAAELIGSGCLHPSQAWQPVCLP